MTAALVLLKRFWPFLLGAVVIAYVLWLRHDLSNARDALKAEQDFRTVLATELGSKRSDRPALLVVAKARMTESGDRKMTLDRISREAQQAGERARQADAALKREQEANARKFASAQRQIKDLQNRKSTGNREDDWKIIEEDTRTPWKGWHQFVPTYRGDDHVWKGASVRQTTVTVNLHTVGSLEELKLRFTANTAVPLTKNETLLGFVELEDNVCDLYIVNPEVDYQPAVLGHELAHCFYGAWHEARI